MKPNHTFMSIKKIYLLILLCFVFKLTNAQYTEVINSNRPGVSRSAFSVGTNVIQLEAGPYTVKEEHSLLDYVDSGFGIDFAARYGFLFPQLEVNIEGIYQNDTRVFSTAIGEIESKRANFRNLAVGIKYLVYDPYKNAGEKQPNLFSFHANKKFNWRDLIPAVSVTVAGGYDTPDNPYTAPGVEGFSPKVILATQNNFASGFVFVINLIKDRIGTDFSDFQYILTLTKALNQKLVLFGEAQGIKSDFYADNLFRFGGAYLWSKDFQLDTALTFNTKDTPSVFSINLGVSYRFDFHKDPDTDIDNNNDAKEEGKRRKRAKGKGKKNKEGAETKKRKKDSQNIDFDDK